LSATGHISALKAPKSIMPILTLCTFGLPLTGAHLMFLASAGVFLIFSQLVFLKTSFGFLQEKKRAIKNHHKIESESRLAPYFN